MVPYFFEILRLSVMLRNEGPKGMAFPIAMAAAAHPAAASSGAGGQTSPPPPCELCSSLPLPAARLLDPAPAPHSQTVKLWLLRQTNRQPLPQGACGQGKEMPCHLVSSLISFWLLDLQMSSSHKVWRQVQLPVTPRLGGG